MAQPQPEGGLWARLLSRLVRLICDPRRRFFLPEVLLRRPVMCLPRRRLGGEGDQVGSGGPGVPSLEESRVAASSSSSSSSESGAPSSPSSSSSSLSAAQQQAHQISDTYNKYHSTINRTNQSRTLGSAHRTRRRRPPRRCCPGPARRCPPARSMYAICP